MEKTKSGYKLYDEENVELNAILFSLVQIMTKHLVTAVSCGNEMLWAKTYKKPRNIVFIIPELYVMLRWDDVCIHKIKFEP